MKFIKLFYCFLPTRNFNRHIDSIDNDYASGTICFLYSISIISIFETPDDISLSTSVVTMASMAAPICFCNSTFVLVRFL